MATTQARAIQGDATPYIRQSAIAHGVNPDVAVAVAMGEGGTKSPGPIGDNGTSFGPYQLHVGGALPSTLSGRNAQQWAWSPQGIDYAMVGIAKVTRGLEGVAAIRAAVINFERPAAPAPEIQRDTQYYNSLAGRGGGPGPTTPGGSGSSAATPSGGGASSSSSSNPGGMLFQCSSGGSVESALTLGLAGGSVMPDVGCYLKSTLQFMLYAFGGLGAGVAGLMLVWPRAGRAVKSLPGKVGTVATLAAAPEVAGAEAVGGAAAARTVREGRAAELHGERVKHARARTSEARARARRAGLQARQEKLATGSSTRLSSVEEGRIRRAQSKVGNPRPDRMTG